MGTKKGKPLGGRERAENPLRAKTRKQRRLEQRLVSGGSMIGPMTPREVELDRTKPLGPSVRKPQGRDPLLVYRGHEHEWCETVSRWDRCSSGRGRVYHQSWMVVRQGSRGLTWEDVFEATRNAGEELEAAGIDLGLGNARRLSEGMHDRRTGTKTPSVQGEARRRNSRGR